MANGKGVLVTGGAGFIGSNLVPALLARGYTVTVLDNLSASDGGYLRSLPVEFVEGDILDPATLRTLVGRSHGIVHLAAQTGVPGSLKDPRRDCELNVMGTLNVLEACRQAGGGMRFVFASSNAPLGRQAPPATEDKAPLPISPYGASKLAGEAYCLAYHGSWGLGTVGLRFANVYGRYSRHKESVVARFLSDLSTTGRLTIDGDGGQTRDFIYVDDLCRAIVLALESNVGGEIFQVATGVETSILQLAALVQEVTALRADVRHSPARGGDIRNSFSSIGKARDMLGWEPHVSLEDGLRLTWEWFSRNESGARASTRP